MPLADELDPMNSMWDWLAHEVKRHRLAAGLSQPQLGKIMGCPKQTVNNVEASSRPPTVLHCDALDEYFDTKGLFRRLREYARRAHDPDWFAQYTGYEARASMIRNYEGQWVPGLFQTPDYARACLLAGRVPDLKAALDARLARQRILAKRNPPEMWLLLDQSVLHRPVGSAAVMRAQLARLLDVSELPHMSLRVVPWEAGAHPGMDGAFLVITVKEGDIAFADAPSGGRLILDSTEVRSFALRYDRIGAKALPENSSRSLIADVMETMR